MSATAALGARPGANRLAAVEPFDRNIDPAFYPTAASRPITPLRLDWPGNGLGRQAVQAGDGSGQGERTPTAVRHGCGLHGAGRLRFADQVAVTRYDRRCEMVTRPGEWVAWLGSSAGLPEAEPGALASCELA